MTGPAERGLTVLVRGVNDVGSAVAHRLFGLGCAVIIHDQECPTATRRGMSFTDAVFDGCAVLENVEALKVDEPTRLPGLLEQHAVIPVTTAEVSAVLRIVQPEVLVDARMQKRAQPEVCLGMAKLTIGLGPNFVVGESVDVVIETSWDNLGAVVTTGASLPFAGEPRAIAGHGRDRYVYAPVAGVFSTKLRIGDSVVAGQRIGSIASDVLTAPLDGVLRGLTRDGVPVSVATKVIEVDPRGDPALAFGIGERPASIADGVVRALSEAGCGRSLGSPDGRRF